MSRFEILLPYYGDVALMQDAVRSVLAQDGDDWRLTVVDDGTEPGVPEWFEQLADPGSATCATSATSVSPATSTAASSSPSTSTWCSWAATTSCIRTTSRSCGRPPTASRPPR